MAWGSELPHCFIISISEDFSWNAQLESTDGKRSGRFPNHFLSAICCVNYALTLRKFLLVLVKGIPLCFYLSTWRKLDSHISDCSPEQDSSKYNNDVAGYLKDGMKVGYIFLLLISTQITQINMRGMHWILKQRGGHLHGNWNLKTKLFYLWVWKCSLGCILWRCDRILWYGRGLTQLSYVRGESKFSDHRPVCSIFSAEVEMINQSQFSKSIGSSSSRVEVEELLPHSVDCLLTCQADLN